jgi:uncharacterized protein YqeY
LLGMVLSAVKNREFDKRAKVSKSTGETDGAKLDEMAKLNDEEIVETISSEIKKRKDSVEQFEKGGRPELAEQEKQEIEMLMVYMPEQMSEDEIKSVVADVIKATGAAGPKDMGKVIGAVMAKIKGKADGTLVSKVVKEELSK